ncbi:MAG TPA: hypothetical protein VFF79_05410 [Conexibacter sp.]|jgi:hypothetical protein|nr:hypothetical protein [Conexibacter sp.]
MRTDPSDTGGLFVTRRPGTRPVQYRTPPRRGDDRRQRLDGLIAAGLLALMVVVNLSFWGPLPLACLWIGGRTQYVTDSVGVGLLAAFITLIGGLLLGLMTLKRLDYAWILTRRASGHDQRQGMIGRIFMICCMIGVPIFSVWFLFFSGAQLSGVSVNGLMGG